MEVIPSVDPVRFNGRHISPHRSTGSRSAPQKAFVVVEDDMLNLSSCSSLTNDSDIMMEDLVLFQPSPQETSVSSKRELRTKRKKKKKKYAQLFFDPDTKTLVTLMEVNLQDRSSSTPKFDQGFEMTKKEKSLPSDKRTFDFERKHDAIITETRFQDQTMLTQSSSGSSEMGREGPEQCRYTGVLSKLHFPDEPIVFSHHDSSKVWKDDNDLSMYLLDSSDDAWEVRMGKSSIGCTESLKRLLMLRSCLSLTPTRNVDTKKWNGEGNDKVMEKLTYSALRDQ
ncbi:MAG: hypothetical protein SGARI_001605 [Bacillariaceae sp.]